MELPIRKEGCYTKLGVCSNVSFIAKENSPGLFKNPSSKF